MEQEIGRLRSDNQKMNAKLSQGLAGPRKPVDPKTISKLPSSTLKEALLEFNHEQARSEEIGRLLQTELANRELRGSEDEEEEEEDNIRGLGEEDDNEEEDVSDKEAEGALDADDRELEQDQDDFEEQDTADQGISTKPVTSNDANNALNSDSASVPSEIASNFEAYEKTAKDIENLDTEIE
jgi:hypothetical protein